MIRAGIVLIALCAAAANASAQTLAPRLANGQLRVHAPRLRVLIGEPLDRLMNGASVTYEFELMVRNEQSGGTLKRDRQRFTVSYDLWEEKFAITRLGTAPRSVSHLTAAAAEVWLVDNLSLTTTGLAPERTLWLRLEYRAEEPAESAQQSGESGMTLGGLIEIFGRRNQERQLRGFVEDTFRLSDLGKSSSR